MKKLTATDGAIFGPFRSVEKAATCWIADGVEYPFSLVGEAATVSEQGDWVPPQLPPPVPDKLSRRQFRQALTRADLREAAEGYVAACLAAGDRDTQDWWDAEEFERYHPRLLAAAALLGQTDADLDALFVIGGGL